jgi:hypothetical protein
MGGLPQLNLNAKSKSWLGICPLNGRWVVLTFVRVEFHCTIVLGVDWRVSLWV